MNIDKPIAETLYGIQAHWYPKSIKQWTFIDLFSMVPEDKWSVLKDYTDMTYNAKMQWGAPLTRDEAYMRKLLPLLAKHARWKGKPIKFRLIEVNVALFVRVL